MRLNYVSNHKTIIDTGLSLEKNLDFADCPFARHYRALDYRGPNFADADIFVSDNMKALILFSKKVNALFISGLLILFYFAVIGFSSFVKKIASAFRGRREEDSYWQEIGPQELDITYFRSPY